MALISGVPVVQNGVQIGASDFSEFTVATGLPAGITRFGIGADSPTIFEIENDIVEGNFFSMDGHGVQAWGFGYDAFFGKIDTGEFLTRVFISFAGSPRLNVGGCASMSGLIGQPEPGPDFDMWGGSGFLRDGSPAFDMEIQGYTSVGGSGSGPLNLINIQEAFQNNAWAWVRVRRVANSGDPTKDDWTGTLWYGDISDEPSSPDGTAVNQVRAISGFAAVGWGLSQFGDLNKQRIAFLSYSGDPAVEVPPVPGDIGTVWNACSVDPATVWAVCT